MVVLDRGVYTGRGGGEISNSPHPWMKNVKPPPLRKFQVYAPGLGIDQRRGVHGLLIQGCYAFLNPVFSKIFKYQGVYSMNWKMER